MQRAVAMRNLMTQDLSLRAKLRSRPRRDGLVVGIEFFQNFLSRPFNVHLKVFQHTGRDTIPFAKQSKENVFGPDMCSVPT
jgi:hypothetical protein